jgi:surfeit locus 1 family protein
MYSVERRRPGVGGAISVAICLVILIGLGVWQLQRLRWKEGVLARVAALQAARSVPLDTVLRNGSDLDYVRVSFDCPDLERRPLLRLFAVRDGQPGYRLITACPLSDEPFDSVLVDRGFVATDSSAAAMQPGQPGIGPVVGILRKGDKSNFVTPANRVAENLWYSRDRAAMASALHAAKPVPAFLMLEHPAPAAGGPIPAPVPADIPNRHLEYALTWFGLAAALVGVYAAMLFRKRRD